MCFPRRYKIGKNRWKSMLAFGKSRGLTHERMLMKWRRKMKAVRLPRGA